MDYIISVPDGQNLNDCLQNIGSGCISPVLSFDGCVSDIVEESVSDDRFLSLLQFLPLESRTEIYSLLLQAVKKETVRQAVLYNDTSEEDLNMAESGLPQYQENLKSMDFL
jgi:hypothetical protein